MTLYLSFIMVDDLDTSWSWPLKTLYLSICMFTKFQILDLYDIVLTYLNYGRSWNIMILTFKILYLSICMVDVLEISNTWTIRHWTYIFVWWTIMQHHTFNIYDLVLMFQYGGQSWTIIYLTLMTFYLSFSMVDNLYTSWSWPLKIHILHSCNLLFYTWKTIAVM